MKPNKIKAVKAWAFIDEQFGLYGECMPNYGRYWIFPSRKEAIKERAGRFWIDDSKIIPVLIYPLPLKASKRLPIKKVKKIK